MTEVAAVMSKGALRAFALSALVVPCAGGIAGATAPSPARLLALPCIQSTGGTDCATTTDGLETPQAVVVSPDGRSVYVAAFGSDAITGFSRGPDGTLAPSGCIQDSTSRQPPCAAAPLADGLRSPVDVAVSPDSRNVYAATLNSRTIVSFDRAADGTLAETGCFAAPNVSVCGAGSTVLGLTQPSAIAVSPDGTSVYVAASSALVRFDRATSGVLTPAGCFDDPTLHVCGASAPGLQGVEGVAVSPDGRSVYATTDADAIVRFDRASDGALTPVDCIQSSGGTTCGAGRTTPGLATPLAVEVSPDGRSVYVASFGSAAVVAFDRAPDGELTPAGCIEDLARSACGPGHATAGLGRPLRLTVSADGRDVFVAAAGALVRLARAPGGALTPAGCLADVGSTICSGARIAGLQSPADVGVSPDGRNVYVVSSLSQAVVALRRDFPPICGTPADGVTVPHGGSVTVPLVCSDLDGDAVVPVLVSGPSHGRLGTIDVHAGAVAYTPAAGYSGADAFSFRGTEPNGTAGDPVNVTLRVAARTGGAAARLTGLRVAPSAFVAFAARGASTALKLSGRRGARVSYRLTRAARVVFHVLQHRAGRLAGRRCVAPMPANRRGRRCTRTVTLRGSFALAGRAGANAFVLTGRLNRRALAPGAYVLAVTPAGGHVATARFTVRRAPTRRR